MVTISHTPAGYSASPGLSCWCSCQHTCARAGVHLSPCISCDPYMHPLLPLFANTAKGRGLPWVSVFLSNLDSRKSLWLHNFKGPELHLFHCSTLAEVFPLRGLSLRSLDQKRGLLFSFFLCSCLCICTNQGWDFQTSQHWPNSAPAEVKGKTDIDFNGSRVRPMMNPTENTTLYPLECPSGASMALGG